MKKLFTLLLVYLAPLLPRANAEPPANRDELLRLVPKDYAFCLVIQDLNGHVQRWQQSGLAKKIGKSPLFEALFDEPALKAVMKMQGGLPELIGLSAQELLDDVLSEEMVFAYRAAPKSENEEGLLLVRARKAAALAKLLDHINALQKKTGELKQLEERVHQGVKYVRRVDDRQAIYYFLNGPFLAVSEMEGIIKKVIEETRRRPVNASSPLALQLQKAGADKALAALWINPRSFDDELKAKVESHTGPGASLLKSFHGHWQALEGIVVSLSGNDEFQLRLTLQARVKDLPASTRPLFSDAVKPSKLWQYFPESSLAVLAGRFDFGGLGEGLGDLADLVQRTVGDPLELDLFKDLMPHLGPDWGIGILPPEGNFLVPQILAALPVQAGAKDIDRSLYHGLEFAARLAVVLHNQTHKDRIQLTTVKQGAVELKVVTGDKALPAGLQPAFAIKDGFLVVATTPAAIQQFRVGAGKAPAGTGVPVFRVSCANLAKLVRERRQPLVAHLAEKNQIPRAIASQGLDAALAGLDLFDHIAVTQDSGGGQLAWTLHIRPAVGD